MNHAEFSKKLCEADIFRPEAATLRPPRFTWAKWLSTPGNSEERLCDFFKVSAQEKAHRSAQAAATAAAAAAAAAAAS